jgi:hypothetical protein
MTVFVAMLAYDTVRMEEYRADCVPCWLLPPPDEPLLLPGHLGPAGGSDMAAGDDSNSSMWGMDPSNPAQVEGVLRHRSLQHVLQVGCVLVLLHCTIAMPAALLKAWLCRHAGTEEQYRAALLLQQVPEWQASRRRASAAPALSCS